MTSHNNSDASWCQIPAGAEQSAQLANRLSQLVEQRVANGKISAPKVSYLREVDFRLSKGSLALSKRELEKLRRLCQLWDVRIRPSEITSHRPVIGPLIVAVKKLIFPLIEFFLRDSMRQQRQFNAAAIRMLAELCQRSESSYRPSLPGDDHIDTKSTS